ncbi:MAG: polysaccharide deacetylase family protein [Phycisphaerales bacterium]
MDEREARRAARPALVRFGPSRRLRGLCRRARAVCLTYDDGPGAELTREVMRVLAAYKAKATFFALGTRAAGTADVLDELEAAGHEIGCHTSRHLNAWKAGSEAVADIRAGYEQLSRWVSAEGMFRPPYGKMNFATMGEVRRRGAAVGWWTIDSGDTHDVLPRVETAAEHAARDGGGVVLLHDFDRASEKAERAAFVVKATELVLEVARQEGMRVVCLGELLSLSGSPRVGRWERREEKRE